MSISDFVSNFVGTYESFDLASFYDGSAFGVAVSFYVVLLLYVIPGFCRFIVFLIDKIFSFCRKRNSPPSGEDK